MSQTSQVFSYL